MKTGLSQMTATKTAGKIPTAKARASLLPGATALPSFSMHSALDSLPPPSQLQRVHKEEGKDEHNNPGHCSQR